MIWWWQILMNLNSSEFYFNGHKEIDLPHCILWPTVVLGHNKMAHAEPCIWLYLHFSHFWSSNIYIFCQKLKAALYYTTLKISNELAEVKEVTLSRQVVASIAETTWGQCQQFAEDLEMFAKYASWTLIYIHRTF